MARFSFKSPCIFLLLAPHSIYWSAHADSPVTHCKPEPVSLRPNCRTAIIERCKQYRTVPRLKSSISFSGRWELFEKTVDYKKALDDCVKKTTFDIPGSWAAVRKSANIREIMAKDATFLNFPAFTPFSRFVFIDSAGTETPMLNVSTQGFGDPSKRLDRIFNERAARGSPLTPEQRASYSQLYPDWLELDTLASVKISKTDFQKLLPHVDLAPYFGKHEGLLTSPSERLMLYRALSQFGDSLINDYEAAANDVHVGDSVVTSGKQEFSGQKCERDLKLKFWTNLSQAIQKDPGVASAMDGLQGAFETGRKHYLRATTAKWVPDLSAAPKLTSLAAHLDVNPLDIVSREQLKVRLSRLNLVNPAQDSLTNEQVHELFIEPPSVGWYRGSIKNDFILFDVDYAVQLSEPKYNLLRTLIVNHEIGHVITTGMIGNGPLSTAYFQQSTIRDLRSTLNQCLYRNTLPKADLSEDFADLLSAKVTEGIPGITYENAQIAGVFEFMCRRDSEGSYGDGPHSSEIDRLHRLISHNRRFADALACEPEVGCGFDFPRE